MTRPGIVTRNQNKAACFTLLAETPRKSVNTGEEDSSWVPAVACMALLMRKAETVVDTLDEDGNLYGTSTGGQTGFGTVFSIKQLDE